MESPVPVAKLDAHISTLFRRGQLINKVSDVVRELIDNAIDAGSTRMQILLDNYGLDKIEVRDDGHGIGASQLEFVVSGGYTSRLIDTNHLSCGEEYGFRGEALSSICSFGTVSIITKTQDEPHAFKYTLDQTGRIAGKIRTGNGRGTVVTVMDLFAKFPVRRNFIREKSRTVSELKEIENYLRSIGLANPPVYLSLVHNGNLIWSKPILKSTEQAIGAIFGFQVAKHLSKCGPVEINSNLPDSVTSVECYIPTVPIDPKLMTTSSNKMCVVVVNRRRVHIAVIEKMLQQYILGAIQMGTTQTNLKGKHPIAILKIDTPSALVDFNRELDKSKVFLQHKSEILDELENILKAFYPIDFNMIKENLDTRSSSFNVQLDRADPVTPAELKQQVLPPVENISLPDPILVQSTAESTRTENILSFLDEIPTTSKQNFMQSPEKTRGFEKRRVCSGSETSVIADASNILPSNSTTTATPTPSSSLSALTDRDWAQGRMKDPHGNIIENVCIVRSGVFQNAVTDANSTPNSLRTPSSNQTSASTTSDTDFFAKLQTCHLKLSGTETRDLYAPPAKRQKPNSFSPGSGVELNPNSSINTPAKGIQHLSRASPVSGDRKQTPGQGQKRYLKLTGTGKLSSSFEPPPAAKNRTSKSFSPFPRVGPKSNANSGISETVQRTLNSIQPPPGVITQVVSCAVDDFFASIEARDFELSRKSLTVQPSAKPPVSTPSSHHVHPAAAALRPQFNSIPSKSIHSSAIFKRAKERTESTSMDLSPTVSQSSSQSVSVRVIGRLPGKALYVVQIESLLGVFSAVNLLKMAPWLQEEFSMSPPNGNDPDEGTVKALLAEFPNLSTDEFTEEMVSHIFTLLKDLAD